MSAAPTSPLVEKVAMVLAAYAWEYGIADTVQEDVGLYVAENFKRYEGQAKAAITACEAEAMLEMLANVAKRLEAQPLLLPSEKELIREARALLARLEGKSSPSSSLGYCPICGAPGRSREKRPDGNDLCEVGHTYPSREALLARLEAKP